MMSHTVPGIYKNLHFLYGRTSFGMSLIQHLWWDIVSQKAEKIVHIKNYLCFLLDCNIWSKLLLYQQILQQTNLKKISFLVIPHTMEWQQDTLTLLSFIEEEEGAPVAGPCCCWWAR
jgi:hypothetical protein